MAFGGGARTGVATLLALTVTGAIALDCVGDDPEATVSGDAAGPPPNEASAPSAVGCPAIYVAANGGADTTDGCSKATPKKTIVAALRAARAIGAKEILVCEGLYPEDHLVVDFGVSLRGGYDCSSWERVADDDLRDRNRTTIVNGNYGASVATVTLRGDTLTRDHVFEGFTVRGGDANDVAGVSAKRGSTAIFVERNAVAILRSAVSGGNASLGTSRGIHVQQGGPEIAFCRVDGGHGKSSDPNSFGSYGIDVRGGVGASIHDDLVNGGAGEGLDSGGEARGSVGLALLLAEGLHEAAGNAVHHNEINGGAGSGTMAATVGVTIRGVGPYDLVDNVIDGGSGTYLGSAGGARSQAVEAFSAPTAPLPIIRLRNSRIHAGDLVGAGAGTRAVSVVGYDLELTNNMISGSLNANQGVVFTAPHVVARHNTLVAGGGPAVQGVLSLAGTGNVVQNNLFVGRGDPGTSAVVLRGCASENVVGVLENNAFVYANGGLVSYGLPAACSGKQTTLGGLLAELGKASITPLRLTGNVRIAGPACQAGEGSACIDAPPCGGGATATDCARGLFTSWRSDGIGEVLLPGGGRLKVGTYCALRGGARDVRSDETMTFVADGGAPSSYALGGVAADLFGRTRTPTVGGGISIGVHELDDATGCVE